MMMPHVDGVTAVRAIHEDYPDIKIIALTNYKEDKLIQNVLEAGAISYLLKNVTIDELAVAIRAAHSGRSMFTSEAAQVLIDAATKPPAVGFDLTAREREVLSLMADGLSNREIAEQLVIGQSTVKNHVSNILSKLDASNRVEAVTMALEHRLLD
jgi:DNA-binding NarL/FixJ family response regulator